MFLITCKYESEIDVTKEEEIIGKNQVKSFTKMSINI
jgi:hypothetical protein